MNLVENQYEEKAVITLTERLRRIFKQPLERVGLYLHGKGIHANHLTFAGIFGTVVGSVFVARGDLLVGGIVILAMGIFDALDGAVARAGGNLKKFGAFFDSVTDRYIELIIYAALTWYFIDTDSQLGIIFSYLAASGSVLVSYARARAQSLGFETKVGLLTRVERIIVIGPAIIFNVPLAGVIIVGVLANITAIQRFLDVWKKAEKAE